MNNYAKHSKGFSLSFSLQTSLTVLALVFPQRQEVTAGILPGSLPYLLCDLAAAAAVLLVTVWCCRCSSVLSQMIWLN